MPGKKLPQNWETVNPAVTDNSCLPGAEAAVTGDGTLKWQFWLTDRDWASTSVIVRNSKGLQFLGGLYTFQSGEIRQMLPLLGDQGQHQ